jgi:hypothetical protein
VANYYDMYGFVQDGLEQVRSDVESMLNIQLAPHDSMYRGGLYYRLGNPGAENFVLQKNYNFEEQEYTEEQFSEYAILLYVNQPQDPFGVEKRLLQGIPYARLLQREIL